MLHSGGAQASDQACVNCHPASGGISGIRDAHRVPLLDPATPRLDVAIQGVTGTAPGQAPEITFRVLVNGSPRDILAEPLATLRATLAGPTTDYARRWQATAQGGGASGTVTAVNAADGVFRYQLPEAAAFPPDATGSYSVGFEASIVVDSVRLPAYGPVVPVAVTDPEPRPRRQIVETMRCDSCHGYLVFHGNNRRGVESCILCHNAEKANDERISRFEGATIDVNTVDFKVMIHKIHRGEELAQKPYILGGNPLPNRDNPAGTPHDFAEVRFPGNLEVCTTCHLPGTFGLPLASTVRASRHERHVCTEDPAADADSFCDEREVTARYVLPETAVCTSCHDAPAVVAHAEVMTTAMGRESCATCHGPGSAYDVARVHTLDRAP
jgi:OmcA/MtrC family decaheme c-type cytochrome